MVSEDALRVKGLKKEYRSIDGVKPVLRGISFSLGAGQVLFVTGRNGSGKTTLIRAIAGEIEFQGSILWHSRGESKRTHFDENVSWIPQNVNHVVADSVRVRELMSVCDTERVREFALAEKMNWMFMDETGQFIKRTMEQLSGGQRQLLVGAVALSKRASIFLLDEVFRPLDSVTVDSYAKMLRDAVKAAQGVAIVVSHDLILAKEYGDRVMVLSSGRMALHKEAKDATPEEMLGAMRS